MSEGHIFCYFVPHVDDHVLLSLLQAGRWTWLYAERMETTELMLLSDATAGELPLTRWQHGRAFDEQHELTWWRKNNYSDLRLLTKDAQPEIGSLQWGKGAEWQAAGVPQETLLHGTRDDEAANRGEARWSEARIPRWLFHPLPLNEGQYPPRQVGLLVQSYAKNDIVGLTRLIAVRGLRVEEQRDG